MEGPVVRSGIAMADLKERMVDIIATVKNFGFAIADAAQTPGVLAHFGYEKVLGHGGRAVFPEKAFAEDLVLLGIFVGQHEHGGAEAVLAGVL